MTVGKPHTTRTMVLVSVECIMRTHQRLASLNHVVAYINDCLDMSGRFTLVEAARTGFLGFFNLVHQRLEAAHVYEVLWFHWFGKALDAACANGHVVIAKRIHALHPEPLAAKSFANAAAHDHLEMLQWLCKHRYGQLCIEHPPSQAQSAMNCCFKSVASGAVANGHIGIVQWLFVTGLIALRVLRSLSVGIARAGSVETFQWFHEKAPTAIAMPNWFDGALERATSRWSSTCIRSA
jgi:hypothetical protein